MLYVPGHHLTLYLGRYKDEPVIMHSYWGVRLKTGTNIHYVELSLLQLNREMNY